ncbi:hypothetical protein IOD16_08980 [Saccharothrix sp. 6-C]|uniref:Alpha/beta hydrolase family protein n=1 Tax=Saccharothrix texasensis TaxID=103734 RepID=A0A3N1H2I8_9PSEU|nr:MULTISPECIES: hypothetical protein [Saccharothrix]QQQ78566.1 hypothetical protein IOD16_08980 [Saccharothrix sp. 6-C]ROP36757.1 hypothetical protein EDD40_2035 [Saccharothrix texasensis]
MEEEPRAGGPSVVWAGPPDAPAVVVLDPAGVGRHGDLPGTWRPLTEHLQVMWCRLPAADEPWQEVDEVLSEFADRAVPVHLVAGAAAGSGVGELIHRHQDLITSAQTFAAPVPLGHPEVVLEVLRELLAQDVEPQAPGEGEPAVDGPPDPGSLLGDAASALRRSVGQLFDRLKDG